MLNLVRADVSPVQVDNYGITLHLDQCKRFIS